MKLNDDENKVLAALAEIHICGEPGYQNFANLMAVTGLDRKAVRRACRSLARKGLTQYQRGLFTECGCMFGSGYAATDAGAKLIGDLAIAEMVAEK